MKPSSLIYMKIDVTRLDIHISDNIDNEFFFEQGNKIKNDIEIEVYYTNNIKHKNQRVYPKSYSDSHIGKDYPKMT